LFLLFFVQAVLGCFFGLGLEVFAGCGLKWFKMVGKGWKRLEKYQKVWESTRKYFRVSRSVLKRRVCLGCCLLKELISEAALKSANRLQIAY
jgi:hypothetical protein